MKADLRNLISTAKALYTRGEFTEARLALEQIVEQNQNLADVYQMLGVVLHDAGLFSRAQNAFERALELNPRYTEAALNLAVLYNDMGRYTEARESYGRALAYCRNDELKMDPYVAGKISALHAEVAEAYRQSGHQDLAIAEYEKALSLRPTFADIRTRLATLLMEGRRFTAAAQELQRALLDRPEYVFARVQLGVCCYSMGKLAEAVQQWRAVLQYDHNPIAAMYLRMVGAEPSAARGQENV